MVSTESAQHPAPQVFTEQPKEPTVPHMDYPMMDYLDLDKLSVSDENELGEILYNFTLAREKELEALRLEEEARAAAEAARAAAEAARAAAEALAKATVTEGAQEESANEEGAGDEGEGDDRGLIQAIIALLPNCFIQI